MRAVLRRVALISVQLLVIFTSGVAFADYLEVQRAAIIRQGPSSDSDELARPAIGTRLTLLDDGAHTNGYYRIVPPGGHGNGWIYRTVVRRVAGALPASGVAGANAALPANSMRAHFVDVAQGNAALLEFSCGVVMIDAGGQTAETSEHLINYLNGFFSARPALNRTIHAIFVTHTHIDHNRALRTVVETFGVRNYVHNGVLEGSGSPNAKWMTQHANDNNRQIRLRPVKQTEIAALNRSKALTDETIDPINCAGTDPKIGILSATYDRNPGWSNSEFVNGNNKSLVIRVDFGKASFLFTGDLEEPAIDTMVAYYRGSTLLDVDVYHVGHHGSHNGTTKGLLDAMTPQIAIISMGKSSDRRNWSAWAYGHPREDVIDLLLGTTLIARPEKWVDVAPKTKNFHSRKMDKAIYGTGWDETIVLTATSEGQFSINVAANGE